MIPRALVFCFCTGFCWLPQSMGQQQDDLPVSAMAAMKSAATYFHSQVAVHGGYVYEYSLDLKVRRGEGVASPTEIWVQPPGTPTVGKAFLRAYEATREPLFLTAAKDAATALIHGQLQSGAWTASIEFDPQGRNADRYRNGQGRQKGKNYSTLDDDKSQAALRLLMQVDQVLEFKDAEIHDATMIALEALLKAQFPNGGFPQGWQAPVTPQPILKASFPDYDWKTENRRKEYWDLYTLNDGLAGTVAETLDLAHQIYGDVRYQQAMLKLGDFLILSQMPEPQPAWAQQYSFEMHPAWARKFEPPAISGAESEDAMQTLLFISEKSGDRRFLEPIPSAIAWIRRSLLPDGQLARFYELQTNRPLYLTKDTYVLTYDDSNLPTHYSFKRSTQVDRIEKQYTELLQTGRTKKSTRNLKTLTRDAQRIVSALDSEGRWVTDRKGNAVVRDDAREAGDLILSSQHFSRNLERLSEYLTAHHASNRQDQDSSSNTNRR